MPGLQIHAYVDKLLFGRSYWRVHREMDRPYRYLGKYHRVLFHDPAFAYMIARKQYPNDSNAVAAAQSHIVLDNVCTAYPAYKTYLEKMEMLKRRNRRKSTKRRTEKHDPTIESLLPDFRKLEEITRLFRAINSKS